MNTKQQYQINLLQQKQETKPMIAAIYARVSSPNQTKGYSLEEQIRICRERCDLMGWKVRYIFVENGVSAKNTDRPKFKIMMEKARQRKFDVLVFWKLDRLCRSLRDVVNVEKELRDYGISLHSVTEQIDTTTPIGRFNFRNIASAAELERELISERAKMGMAAMAMHHKWPNRLPPLGYDKGADGRLKINEEEANLVRKIFEMYLELKSMPQIAFELNKLGIKTKRGKEWTTTAVKRILDNKIYIGIYEVAGVRDYVEEYKIIDDELFNKVKEVRERYKRIRREMPKDRKMGTIEKIFSEYFEYLKEMEEKGLIPEGRIV